MFNFSLLIQSYNYKLCINFKVVTLCNFEQHLHGLKGWLMEDNTIHIVIKTVIQDFFYSDAQFILSISTILKQLKLRKYWSHIKVKSSVS